MLYAIKVKIKIKMENTSYVIKELNKFANSPASQLSNITQGLDISIEARVKLVSDMAKKQDTAFEAFTIFSYKVIP
jgi:hypothetical protein